MAYLRLHVASSSHLSEFDSNNCEVWERVRNRARFNQVFSEGVYIDSYKGLTMAATEFPKKSLVPLAEKSDFRCSQVRSFTKNIQFSSAKCCLTVAASNDWKVYFVEKGVLLPLVTGATELWAGLDKEEKIKFSLKKHMLLPLTSETYMKDRI